MAYLSCRKSNVNPKTQKNNHTIQNQNNNLPKILEPNKKNRIKTIKTNKTIQRSVLISIFAFTIKNIEIEIREKNKLKKTTINSEK